MGRRPGREYTPQAKHRASEGKRGRDDADLYDRRQHRSWAHATNLMEVWLWMFEILLQNSMEADTKRAGSYGSFIEVLKEIEKNKYVAEDTETRNSPDWKKFMDYVHLRRLHVIDMKNQAETAPRISPGVDRAAPCRRT